MASQEFENASTYIKTFANAWPSKYKLRLIFDIYI